MKRIWWWIEHQRTWVHIDADSQEVADAIVARLTGVPLFEIVVVGSDPPSEPTIQQRNISANKQFFASIHMDFAPVTEASAEAFAAFLGDLSVKAPTDAPEPVPASHPSLAVPRLRSELKRLLSYITDCDPKDTWRWDTEGTKRVLADTEGIA